MTNREFYTAIVTGTVILNAGKETEQTYSAYVDGELIPELKEFAETAIGKLDAKNEAAKGRKTAKKANPENEKLKEVILGAMEADKVYTAKWAAEYLNGELAPEEPYTTQKTSALLRQLVEAGKVIKLEGKKGKTIEYKLNAEA